MKKRSLLGDIITLTRYYAQGVARKFTNFGGYSGASRVNRAFKEWLTPTADANADILPDLETLRTRSQDLVNNNPIAKGIIDTEVTCVIGTGLKLQSRVDRAVVNMTDEASGVWESKVEREWRAFWNSKSCSTTNTMTGRELSVVVFSQALVRGDSFIVFHRFERQNSIYDLRLQIIEPDRVCNPDFAPNTTNLAGGIETDKFGAPIKYHILQSHPGTNVAGKKNTWKAIPAYGKELGLPNILHIGQFDRSGQSRCVPILAPVIEELKQLSRATKNELMATTISSLFTVFLESEDGYGGGGLGPEPMSDEDIKLGNGLIVELPPGKKIHDSNPGRPNINFDPFFQAIVRQIGAGVGIPAEIIIKTFNKSYSASKAALLEAWRHFLSRREWFVSCAMRPIYEVWLHEAVATGRVHAPGFFTDSTMRSAYLSSDWVGPAKGQLDELKDILAAKHRIAVGVSNISIEAAELGRDWETIHAQSVRETIARISGGLLTPEGELSEK